MAKYLILVSLAVFLTGCGGAANHVTVPRPPVREEVGGIYHKVQKGETLWRISKMYDADVETIASANRLPNTSQINEGQLLFIPQQEIPSGSSKTNSNFIWPLKGKIISFFGNDKDGVKNKGIDIKARYGEAVAASRDGKVSLVDENMKGFGKTIIIDHEDGYSSVYAHNSEILVKSGQKVRQGTVIAKAGQTGRAESVRVHFEIRKKHIPQNPFYFLP